MTHQPFELRIGYMKAIVLEGFGAPAVMRLGEVPTSKPARGRVRVRVAATSVNQRESL
jgi:NADPH:quinone reductase-like Zn-dependent oxidoreductase